MEGFTKYAVELRYLIPKFMKIGSNIQKFVRDTHRQHGDRISLYLFLQNKESRL
jgi:hypothetical protein